MNTLLKYRRFIVHLVGILPLILSLGTSTAVRAATATSDLSITLVPDHGQAKIGQTITYIATMTNHGPDDALFVDVAFSLPDQLNLVSMTCDRGISPDTPYCEYSTLPAGDTVVSTLVVTPNPSALHHDKKVTLTASAAFEVDCSFDPDHCTFDPNTDNNLVSVSTKLIGKLAHP